MSCPIKKELSYAPTGDPGERLRAHLPVCQECNEEWQKLRALAESARAVELELPSAARREQVRGALVAAAGLVKEERSSARVLWAGVGLALAGAAAGIAAMLIFEPVERTEHRAKASAPIAFEVPDTIYRGRVHPHATARFRVLSSSPDERVELDDGTIDVEVEHLRPGERFRVFTQDGEVEVRGTSFTVSAAERRLESVRVMQGRVEVRHSRGITVLEAEETWRAEPLVLPAPPTTSTLVRTEAAKPRRIRTAAPEPAPVPAPVSETPGPTPAAAPAPSLAEISFNQAFAELRAGEFARAAASFARCTEAAPDGALAEDARYWRAVALDRAGDSRLAARALVDFLDRHPASSRAGEASVMLGWILLSEGDLDGADARFKSAENDVAAAVQRSLLSGRAEVRARRARR
jgi:TolA-binding protein